MYTNLVLEEFISAFWMNNEYRTKSVWGNIKSLSHGIFVFTRTKFAICPRQLLKPHPPHKLYTVKYAPPDSGGKDEIGIRCSPDPSMVGVGTPD